MIFATEVLMQRNRARRAIERAEAAVGKETPFIAWMLKCEAMGELALLEREVRLAESPYYGICL